MHHGILIKVNGKDDKDAKRQADTIIQETLRCPHCERSKYDINWDGFSWVGEVDEKWIKEKRSGLENVKTVEDLVVHYKALRNVDLQNLTDALMEEFRDFFTRLLEIKSVPSTMLAYHLEKIEKLQDVIKFEDEDEGLYTLHCIDNHYADMSDYTEGEKSFYFWYDRHY